MSVSLGTSTITLPLVKLIDWILAFLLMIKVFSLTSPEIVVHLPPLRVTVDPGAFNVTLTSLPSAFLFVTVIGADELDVTVDPSTNIALIVVDFVVSEVIITFWTVASFETVNEASCNVTVSYVPLLRVTYGVEPSAGALTVKLVDSVPVLLIVMFFGDVKFKEKSYNKMKELISDEHRTVIIVSHSLGTIKELCNEVLWLNDGKVMMIGKPEDVIPKYEEFMRQN